MAVAKPQELLAVPQVCGCNGSNNFYKIIKITKSWYLWLGEFIGNIINISCFHLTVIGKGKVLTRIRDFCTTYRKLSSCAFCCMHRFAWSLIAWTKSLVFSEYFFYFRYILFYLWSLTCFSWCSVYKLFVALIFSSGTLFLNE
jgi:hypothetical protein